MSNEKQILQFLQTVEKLKSTLRHNWTKTGKQESSAEHSWRIAIFFILVQESYGYDIDVIKTFKMILIHDIPELMHGDIPGFEKEIHEKTFKNHKERELEAGKKIFSQLGDPLGTDLYNLFVEFETGTSKEARLASALDKVESQLQHLDSGPEYWSNEERGEHMLHYPDKALNNLKDIHISKIWELIKEEIIKFT